MFRPSSDLLQKLQRTFPTHRFLFAEVPFIDESQARAFESALETNVRSFDPELVWAYLQGGNTKELKALKEQTSRAVLMQRLLRQLRTEQQNPAQRYVPPRLPRRRPRLWRYCRQAR